MVEKKAMTLRLPPELWAKIAARAAKHHMSQTEWINRALERMVEMPSQVTQRQERF